MGSSKGATVPVQIGQSQCNALVDTGVSKSIISEKYFQYLMLPDLKQVYNIDIRSAPGNKLKILSVFSLNIFATRKFLTTFSVSFILLASY